MKSLFTIILLTIALSIVSLCLILMTTHTPEEVMKAHNDYVADKELPPDVTDVEYLKNGWVVFKWRNMKFLYQCKSTSSGLHTALSRID